MDSFLLVLPFTPMIIGIMWIYVSPMMGLKERNSIKALIRVPLYFAVFGGIAVQESYLAHHEALRMRSFYEAALAVVTLIPMCFVMIYQYRRNREARASVLRKTLAEQKRQRNLQEEARVLQTTYLADGSLRAEILPPRNQAAYKLMAVVSIVGISVIAALQFFVERQVATLPSSSRITVYHFMQIVVSLASAYIFAGVLTGKQILTVSRRELQMQHVLLGIVGPVRRFDCSDIANLCFAQWQMASGRGLRNCSGLSFQVGATSAIFGETLTQRQVEDLISKIRDLAKL